MRNVTSAARPVAIPGPVTTSASCRPRPARSSCGYPSFGRRRSETAIIERYRRRESSVEEALIEMYLAGVSVRRVEDHHVEQAPRAAVDVIADEWRLAARSPKHGG